MARCNEPRCYATGGTKSYDWAGSADHAHRTLGISREVLAYRSQEHPDEPAVAARAHHEHIGVLGEVDEQFRRVARARS